MTRLSVNLNKVALLRNQRDIGYPSVIETGRLVLEAGAQGLTVHPRPDERHIRKSDIGEIAAFLKDWPDQTIEFNIEGYPDVDFLALVTAQACDQVTLVPDAPGQRTSDHGWNIPQKQDLLRGAIKRIQESGARIGVHRSRPGDGKGGGGCRRGPGGALHRPLCDRGNSAGRL